MCLLEEVIRRNKTQKKPLLLLKKNNKFKIVLFVYASIDINFVCIVRESFNILFLNSF